MPLNQVSNLTDDAIMIARQNKLRRGMSRSFTPSDDQKWGLIAVSLQPAVTPENSQTVLDDIAAVTGVQSAHGIGMDLTGTAPDGWEWEVVCDGRQRLKQTPPAE